MNPGCLAENPEVAWVRRKNVITITGQAYHRRVDGVGGPAPGQENPGPAAEGIINRADVSPGEEPGQLHLAPAATPGLGCHSAAGHRRSPGQPLTPDEGDNTAIAALSCDKRYNTATNV